MATLKTTYIQHPDSLVPQISLSASAMSFAASALELTGGTLDLPDSTTISGSAIATEDFVDESIAPIQSDLNLKASSASPTFSGVVTADNYDIGLTTLNSDSIALDFSAETGLYTRSAGGTITFTATNYRAGAMKTVRIVPGGSSRTLNFPTNWVFVGPKPTTVAANKTGMLTVTSFGTTEADCVAAWAEQI